MDLLTVIVLTAALGAVYALAAGITSMMYNREVAHLDSKNWMAWRVLWQSIAVLFMMVGVMGPAPSTAAVERDCVYDYQMMSTA